MKKELKDYLHLYLGCLCYKRLSTVTNKRPQVLTTRLYDWAIGGIRCQTIIPILRPLSDMTDGEMQECGNMVYDFSNDEELNKWQPSDFEIGLAPEQFYWLLSKHFDLFGLIESGLAIDATTL